MEQGCLLLSRWSLQSKYPATSNPTGKACLHLLFLITHFDPVLLIGSRTFPHLVAHSIMANNGLTQPPWFTTPVSNLNVTDEAEQSAQPKTRKRTRISVACKTCRTRKSRCDGRLPCSTCSDVGLVCEYDDPSYKPAQDKDVSQLEERLRVLEKQLAALQEKGRQNETLQATSPSAGRLDDRSLQCDASTPGTSLIEDEGDVVDGMGAVSLREDSAEQEYIGKNNHKRSCSRPW